MPSPDASLCSVLTGGDGQPGCGRFLTFFFLLRNGNPPSGNVAAKLSPRATQAKDISVVAGGRPHWLAVPGGRGATPAARMLAYLLLNFSGCFSLIMWNLCAMEASWKQKKRRQKEAWLMVVAMSCGRKGHIGAPGMPKFRRLQVTAAQHHVQG